MQITQQFDGGNIVVLAGSNADEIRLEIRSDPVSYTHLTLPTS